MIEYLGVTYFSEAELSCTCGACGPVRLAPGFEAAALQLRITLGMPMTVTGPGRCWKHNQNVAGHPRSLHVYDESYWETGGMAAFDIRMRNGQYNLRLIELAAQQNWCIGLNFGNKFFHLDRRIDHIPAWKGTDPTLFSY